MQPDKPLAMNIMTSAPTIFFMFCLYSVPQCVAFDPWHPVLKLILEKVNRVWFHTVSTAVAGDAG